MKRNRSPTSKNVTLCSSIVLRSVLDRFSIGSPIVLLSFSYRPSIVLLSSFYRPSIILLSFFYCEAETIRKQYGNDTG